MLFDNMDSVPEVNKKVYAVIIVPVLTRYQSFAFAIEVIMAFLPGVDSNKSMAD